MLYDTLGMYWLLVLKCMGIYLVEPYAPYAWGGGLGNVTTFGHLRTINPKFGPANEERWQPFEACSKLAPPVRSHTGCQERPRPRPWYQYLRPPVAEYGHLAPAHFTHFSQFLGPITDPPENEFSGRDGLVG